MFKTNIDIANEEEFYINNSVCRRQ